MNTEIGYWEKLKEELKTKRMILLGETHGTDANIKAAFDFISKLDPKVLALELEPKWATVIDNFKKNALSDILKLFDKESWVLQAGVMSGEHIKLIKDFLKNDERSVSFFAVQDPDWNQAEQASTEELKKIGQKGYTIVMMGSLHARKMPFMLKKKKAIPIGNRLKDQAVSIRIRYVDGKAFNFGEIVLRDKKAAGLFSKTDHGLMKSTSKYFDYDYIVRGTAKPLQR